MDKSVVLTIDNLCKSFGPTKANCNINLEIRSGEVLGLAGENGSGKSTLLSQVAGIYSHDSGTMTLFGEPYAPTTALEANSKGIAMVVQELGTVSCLPVAPNIFLGRMDQYTRFGLINFNAMNQAVEEICEKWEIPTPDLHIEMSQMDVESRKMVELVRALAMDPKILILDEVTQALSRNNRDILLKVINKFREQGKTVCLISHDIEEVIEITDRIVVLRDGEIVDDLVSKETDADYVKRSMVGRNITHDYYRDDTKPSRQDEVVLSVDDLSVKNEFEPLTFSLYAGEILGFCGLSDSGIHLVGKALYGVDTEGRSGTVVLNRGDIEIDNAVGALHNKVGYLPKERDHDCLMLKANIKDNLSLANLDEVRNGSIHVSSRKLDERAKRIVDQYQIRCTDIRQTIGDLSGGNKQKVNLARWMSKDLDVLILDCPTRGVDVLVKAYIYQLMKQAKEEGLAIILISDELPEILGMSDRIMVMKEGKVVTQLDRGPDFTEEKIIEVMI